MKSLTLLTLAIVGMLMSGCAHHRPMQTAKPAKPVATAATETIVTPDNSIAARVVSYNSDARFVILGFPVGQMPKIDQTLFLYRNGLKVAEVKITGPQRDNNIVADVVTGEIKVGDEVRDR